MHTQKKWCACVHGYDGYYLAIVKLNQPQMYQDLGDFFADPEAEQQEWQYAKSVQKGHGRLEIREIWTSTQMNEWFETQWAGVAQVFRLRRSVFDGAKEREQIVYGVTNLREARKRTPLACSSSNKPIGASKIGSTAGVMSPIAGRCLSGTYDWCSSSFGCPQWRGPRASWIGSTCPMWHLPCTIFARIPWKPCNYCAASFCGRTGTPKSPAHPTHPGKPLVRSRSTNWRRPSLMSTISGSGLGTTSSGKRRAILSGAASWRGESPW